MNRQILFNKKVSNFAGSLINHAMSGFVHVTDAQKEARLEICKACDKYIEAPMGPQCKECGCLLNVKAGWASEQCPLKKWLAETTAPQKSNCGSCDK